MKNKILLTGAPGWIGTKLFKSLLDENKEVTCLVHPSFYDKALKELNAEIIVGDITNPDSLKGICKNIKSIFHCAGIIHPKRSKLFYEINTQGTINLVNEAVSAGVEKFIYISSSSAGISYTKNININESTQPSPYMDYGLSKLKAEKVLNCLYQEDKIKIVIVRPHWLYGEGGPERQLKFFKLIKKNHPFLFGDGSSLRSLCDINNCIQALILAEKKDSSNGQTYYIGDKRPYTSLEIYQTTGKALGISVKPIVIKVPSVDSLGYKLIDRVIQGARFYLPEYHLLWDMCKSISSSIEKAQIDLGYNPRINLLQGTKIAIKYYLDQGISI